MGQRNIVYTGPMLNTEHSHLRPEPCVIPYGGIPSFPQPTNNHSILPPPPGTLTNFNPQHLPENHVPLPHGITQFNGIDHQLHHHHHHHPANNVFMTPRVFPVAINHTMQDQSPYSTIHGNFENGQLMDVFKRKSADGFPGNIQYFYPAMGSSSSSVGMPMNTEGTSSSRLIPGNYGGQPLQAVHNPWLDQQFCGNGSDNAVFSWNHGQGIPYLQGPINGGGMEAANVGLRGYQVTANTRNPTAFVHPPVVTPHQGPQNLHHPPPPPPPPMQGLNMDFHSQLASTSRRLPTNNTINPFQNGIESRPRFVGPAPPTGLGVYRPHRRELMVDATARHRVYPHLRVLPEDGVAILDISGYHEAGHSVDHHRDMRLDIDHMSYEELLALGEQIGSAGSCLSDDFILKHLITRVFASSISFESEDASSADQELNSCVICQSNYDDKEQIGVLDCGHEYHVECVKKWLAVKNTCPVCKSTGLAAQAKEA